MIVTRQPRREPQNAVILQVPEKGCQANRPRQRTRYPPKTKAAPALFMNVSAAIADAWLKRDGREKHDGQGQGSHVTRASLLALVARTLHFTTNRHEQCVQSFPIRK